MHKQTKTLQKFYDNQADKFSGTRKRHWPEFDHILAFIKSSFTGKKNIRVLELGCGDGRLLGYLQSKSGKNISYTGVDISYNLLDIANRNHPEARWVHKDMVTFFQDLQKEEFDVVIAVASFHHLPTENQRSYVLDGIYDCLAYDGVCIMTNRCYSTWFKDKYRSEIRFASWKSIVTLGYKNKNDIMIPWKDNEGSFISDRLYHIFTPKELTRLIKASGFSNIDHFYVDNDGNQTLLEKEGRNLVTSMRKTIFE